MKEVNDRLRVVVVDDELPARQAIHRQIERHCPGLDVVYAAANAAEAYREIKWLAPDVVFLDIRMPDESGMELLDRFPERDFYVVFCTTYHEYAVEAIRKQAFDYLLKPVDAEELKACARRISDHFRVGSLLKADPQPDPQRKIELQTSGHRHFVKVGEILNIEASGSYSTFFLTEGRRITISKNLKRVEELIDDPGFFRVHNSQLVQLSSVQRCNYRSNTLTLMDGSEVPMAVRKRDEVRLRLEQLMVDVEGPKRRRRREPPMAAEPRPPLGK